jgi:type III pantothenate kinase
MLVAVDIGNTNVVAGIFEGRTLKTSFRYETVRSRSADEQAVLLAQLLALHRIPEAAITGSIVCSVVPQATDAICKAITTVSGVTPLVVGESRLKINLRIQSDNPREVGADRIVNSIRARELVTGAAIVVDFGTATTFDCISAEGDYVGGAIVPGVQVSLEALISRAAKLSRVDLVAPKKAIGKNTTHAIQSGVVFGYAALVDGLVDRLKAELGDPVTTLATGGLAELIAEHTRSIEQVVPSLTLDGLCSIYDHQRGV